MKTKMVFIISFLGAAAGIAAAIVSGITQPALPPAYNPAASPYQSAIYAEGIIESAQTSGENINIYPEVAGTVKEILVSEGQQVKAGQALLQIDDSDPKSDDGAAGFIGRSCRDALKRAESGAEKRDPRCRRCTSGCGRSQLENRPGYVAERSSGL